MSQTGIDLLIEEQGEATATLHENAAGARQQSQTNGKGISRIFYLLIININIFKKNENNIKHNISI